MKDKKIFNILLLVVSFVMFCLTIDVSAANTTVDATKCKDGKVYTNYYFFLEVDNTTDGHAATGQDYLTDGYYKNEVIPTSLKSVVSTYGLTSDQFLAAVGIDGKGEGVVPISATDATKALSVTGVGLRTFYELLTGNATSSGNDVYFIEHGWSKQNGQISKPMGDNRITFGSDDIINMMNATVLLTKYSISSTNGLSDLYENYPIDLKINRKYSEGMTPELTSSSFAPISVTYADNVARDSYLQPALYYIQYCEKAEEELPTDPETFVVRYDANGGKNAPATSATTNVGTCVNISSDKPTRSGYEFLGWSRDAKATAADDTYAAGKCYKGTDGSITLYAVWKGVENPGTGVASQILSYIAIIGLGIGGLLLMRKKGLFRQM